jgi:hypothetical protein
VIFVENNKKASANDNNNDKNDNKESNNGDGDVMKRSMCGDNIKSMSYRDCEKRDNVWQFPAFLPACLSA